MGTLYLDRKNLSLKLDSHCLALYIQGRKSGTIPFHILDKVVVRGNVELESRLLCAFSDHKIDVVFLSGRNSTKKTMSFRHSHNDVRRRLAQYQGYFLSDFRGDLALRLVTRKIEHQKRFLHEVMDKRSDKRKSLFDALKTLDLILAKLEADHLEVADIGRLRGYEGAAAGAYFSAYCSLFAESLQFNKRRKRPPKDPVNACLSLGYTLLHFEAVSVCYMVGLDPLLGFYHEPVVGRESLACDLIEPVRPYLDAWVWALFRDRILTRDHFVFDSQRCLLNKNGRKYFYANYEQFVQPIRRLLRLYGYQLAKNYLAADWDLPI